MTICVTFTAGDAAAENPGARALHRALLSVGMNTVDRVLWDDYAAFWLRDIHWKANLTERRQGFAFGLPENAMFPFTERLTFTPDAQ